MKKHHNQLFSLKGAYPDLKQLLSLRNFTGQFSLDIAQHTSSSAGSWQSRARGRGLDFAEVRLYHPGDDIRSIDWRVTAKTQKTHTRLFTQERERPVILAADLRSDMFFGSLNCFKSVSCAALMSALSWIALDSGDRVGGLVIGDLDHMELRPKASRKVVLSFIHYIEAYCRQLNSPIAQSSKQSMNHLFAKLQRVTKPGSSVFVASDFHDIESVNVGHLAKLCRHNQVTFFLISDPLEWELPANAQLQVTDGENISLLTAQANNSIMENRVKKIQQICDPLNIEVIHLSTGDNILGVLQNRFSTKRTRGLL